MSKNVNPRFVFASLVIAAVGLLAHALLTYDFFDSRNVFIDEPHLEPKSSFERVNIALVLHNLTAREVQICGVQACCGLRHIAVPKLLAPDSSCEIIFEGSVPEWETFKGSEFEWKGEVFVELDGLKQVPFRVRVAKKE